MSRASHTVTVLGGCPEPPGMGVRRKGAASRWAAAPSAYYAQSDGARVSCSGFAGSRQSRHRRRIVAGVTVMQHHSHLNGSAEPSGVTHIWQVRARHGSALTHTCRRTLFYECRCLRGRYECSRIERRHDMQSHTFDVKSVYLYGSIIQYDKRYRLRRRCVAHQHDTDSLSVNA